MTGLKTTDLTRKQVLAAARAVPADKNFVWDGKDEDTRPATAQELAQGLESMRRQRGRPAGSGTKEQVAIRFDRDVLDALRATGKGWQTRVNDAMREWVKVHKSHAHKG